MGSRLSALFHAIFITRTCMFRDVGASCQA